MCESTADTLPYTGADCTEIDAIEARLSISNPKENEGELGLYIFHSGNKTGDADEYLRLVLNNDR